MKKSTPLKTEQKTGAQGGGTSDHADRTWIAADEDSSDFGPASDSGTAIRAVDLESDTPEDHERLTDDPFADTGFGRYAEGIDTDVEPFPPLTTSGDIEAEMTDADEPPSDQQEQQEGFALEAAASEPNAESVVPWATSSFPEEDSLSGHRPARSNASTQVTAGGKRPPPDRDVVGLSSSAEAAHGDFGPQAFSQTEITQAPQPEDDEDSRNEAETAPNGQTVESSDHRETGAFKSINLNAPLYPLEQDEDAQSHEHDHHSTGFAQADGSEELFTLPQSLEEASARLREHVGSGHTEAGPEVTLSEPDFHEFEGTENSQARRVGSREETHGEREHLGSSGADPFHTADDLGGEDEGSGREESAPLMTFALTPYVQTPDRQGDENSTLGEADSDAGTGEPSQTDEPGVFRVVIESRNTRTREVLMTEEEFNLAERQILEERKVHISGKALVLDAVAITKAAPQELRRRRRPSAA